MTTPPVQPPTEDFFATCPRNTEGLLAEELRAMGASDARDTRGGVTFTGPVSLAYRACLWSRLASRVLMRLAVHPVGEITDLYEAAHGMPWEDHLDADGTLAVEATTTISQGPLATVNTHFVEQRVKDAVVDRFRARTGRRPGVDLTRPDLRIAVHLAPAQVTLSLDLSGQGLHRRGYRLEGGGAPLKENLAAAILLRAGWPRLAAQGRPLLDPLCGSGTLLIEGGLMAADVAPGLLRDYCGFLHWKGFDQAVWEDLLAEAVERRREGLKGLPPLFGSDVDARVLGAARGNARRAGLAGRIQFTVSDLATLASPRGAIPGLMVTNPPYGKRLGEVTELVLLYETLGERLKRSFAGWEAAVFTANPDLSVHLGLRARRVNVLYNGPLEAKLLQFDIGPGFSSESMKPQPAGDAAAEASPPRTAAGRGPGALMFANRLQKNLKHLRRWAAREQVSCYRLYDADIPEYAVAVDLYDGWAHIQEYAPPSGVDPVQARRRLKDAVAVVPDVLDIPPSHVVLKVRRRQRGSEQYERLEDRGSFLEVEEGGLRFLVNLTDYLDTGLFLDHRPVRRLIRELASGRRFLNLFAYTGSATVCAAAGGALATTTVDLSRVYLEWAARNLNLNGCSGPQHSFIRADCLAWLKEATAQRKKSDAPRLRRGISGTEADSPDSRRNACAAEPGGIGGRQSGPAAGRGARGGEAPLYDLIFLDAPTFSNSKNMEGTLDVQRDHLWLVRSAMTLLAPGGILLFSTNFRRFKLDPVLGEEFSVADITRQTIPPDFARNPRIHACFRIEAAARGH